MRIKNWIGCAVAIFCVAAAVAASGANIMIEDFESELVLAPGVKTGWESNGGEFSTALLSRSMSDAKSGGGAGAIAFNVKPGSWALVQKKIEGAEWLTRGPKAISFWVKGEGTGKMTVELEESYTFKWRKEVPVIDKNWQHVTLNFTDFSCDDKPGMSVPDLVAFKFICFGGALKIRLDDIEIECAEQPGEPHSQLDDRISPLMITPVNNRADGSNESSALVINRILK